MEVGNITPGHRTFLKKGQTHSEDQEWKGGGFRYLQRGWCGDCFKFRKQPKSIGLESNFPIPVRTQGMCLVYFNSLTKHG